MSNLRKLDLTIKKESCFKCKIEFPRSDLKEFQNQKYCPTCFIDAKEDHKRQKEEKRKQQEINATSQMALTTKETQSIPAIITVPKTTDEDTVKKLGEMQQYMKTLEDLFLKSMKGNTNTDTTQLVNKILMDFVKYDFDAWVEKLLLQYDLKKFDHKVTMTRINKRSKKSITVTNNFFYFMEDTIDQTPEIVDNTEKLTVARFINRIKRGDSAMYKVIFNSMKDTLIALLRSTT